MTTARHPYSNVLKNIGIRVECLENKDKKTWYRYNHEEETEFYSEPSGVYFNKRGEQAKLPQDLEHSVFRMRKVYSFCKKRNENVFVFISSERR